MIKLEKTDDRDRIKNYFMCLQHEVWNVYTYVSNLVWKIKQNNDMILKLF